MGWWNDVLNHNVWYQPAACACGNQGTYNLFPEHLFGPDSYPRAQHVSCKILSYCKLMWFVSCTAYSRKSTTWRKEGKNAGKDATRACEKHANKNARKEKFFCIFPGQGFRSCSGVALSGCFFLHLYLHVYQVLQSLEEAGFYHIKLSGC